MNEDEKMTDAALSSLKSLRAAQPSPEAKKLALNAAMRIDNHMQLNAGIGYGANENLVGGRVGLRIGW